MVDIGVIGSIWPGALEWVLGLISVLALLAISGDKAWAIARARRESARSAASQDDHAAVRVWAKGGSFRHGLGGSTNIPNLILTIGSGQVSLREMSRIGPAATVVGRRSEHRFRVEGGHLVVEDISGMAARLGVGDAERARQALVSFGWLTSPSD
jgi:hypothetical protein